MTPRIWQGISGKRHFTSIPSEFSARSFHRGILSNASSLPDTHKPGVADALLAALTGKAVDEKKVPGKTAATGHGGGGPEPALTGKDLEIIGRKASQFLYGRKPKTTRCCQGAGIVPGTAPCRTAAYGVRPGLTMGATLPFKPRAVIPHNRPIAPRHRLKAGFCLYTSCCTAQNQNAREKSEIFPEVPYFPNPFLRHGSFLSSRRSRLCLGLCPVSLTRNKTVPPHATAIRLKAKSRLLPHTPFREWAGMCRP